MAFCLTVLGGCGGSDAPTPDAGAPLMDQCLASSDMAIVLAARGDGGVFDAGLAEPLTAAGDCALTDACSALYFGGDIPAGDACVNACLDTTPVAGLSSSCRACYVVVANGCAATDCLLACVGSDRSLCLACLAEKCQDRITTCIGY